MAAMQEYGYPMMIVRTYDTLERQRKLYAQGRTEPGNIVTKVDKGWHNIRVDGKPCARAVDLAFKKQRRFPNRDNWSLDWPWERLKIIAAACDLKRTLRWDLGHLVDTQGQTFRQAWADSDRE
jgi:hypothetical protein